MLFKRKFSNLFKALSNTSLNNLSFQRSASAFESINRKQKPLKKYHYQEQKIKKQESLKTIDYRSITYPNESLKFEDEVLLRREQAKNSVLFKIDNESDLNSLLDDIDRIDIGDIKNIFFIGERSSSSKAALIEFESKQSIDILLSNYGQHFSNSEHLPCVTRLLVYRLQKNSQIDAKKKLKITYCISNNKEEINSSNNLETKFSFLKSIQNTDEQIENLYDHFKIEDIGYRIRYFVASVVEESFHSLFNNCICLPFGSSANKFGHRASDLDLLFSLDNKFYLTPSEGQNLNQINRLNGKIIFYSKYNKNDQDRDLARQFLELAYFILANILPKFSVRQLIKGARVPILEFDFELPSKQKLNCDLSMSNLQASYQMTKLFWTYSKLDSRIAPLIFLIKYWADLTNITNTIRPSPNITNFQLTVLILNFLLRLDNPLILPLESIITYIKTNPVNNKSFSDNDLRYTINDSLNITDFKSMIKIKNKILLKDLLLGFFNYYSNFDFESNMISLSKNLDLKTAQFKNEALVILNPFMPELNASKNVNRQHLKKFAFLCNESYEALQLCLDTSTQNYNLVDFFKLISAKAKKIKNETNEANSLADEMNNFRK